MSWFAALFVAAAAGGGAWLLLRRNLFEVLLGLALLSQAVNLLVLASGGYRPGAAPPLVTPADLAGTDAPAYVDPLPQALVLTAIVIGFGLLCFFMVLIARSFEAGSPLAFEEPPPEGGE